ncbi:hypothetical protein ABZZ44_09140 [Streptomyces sp. NPDC006460]|uniref:hypothetical protein n=1 Tax=Streptomyces sp. NPDC006460 TaxID=3154304 RepID=UPI0033A62A8F
MSAQTLSEMSAPLIILRILNSEFPDLPAPCVSVSTVYPDILELSFHDDFPGFEAWRDALGIDPVNVTHRVQRDGCTGVLRVHADYAGARIELTAYAKIPAAEGTCSRAGIAP